MKPPEAELTFAEEALLVRSNLGSAVLPWAGFRACWEGAGFGTLPAEGLSAEARAFVRGRVAGGS